MPKKTRPDSEEARLKRDTEDIMNRVMLLGMRYFKLQLNRKIEEMEAGLGYSAGEPVLETASQTFVKKGLSPTHKTAISQGRRKSPQVRFLCRQSRLWAWMRDSANPYPPPNRESTPRKNAVPNLLNRRRLSRRNIL